MNITEAKYYKGTSDDALFVKATIDGEETHVPAIEGNRHWKALQEWVAEGNTIAEAD
tara:strand:+ start:418 stop:588 length:171 start_codon:yes stop_codon:yes gene_type:complete